MTTEKEEKTRFGEKERKKTGIQQSKMILVFFEHPW